MASLEEIARRAGVSIGTLYNRFPSRADLIDTVFADRVATTAEIAEHALSMDDPWAGFVHFVERVGEMQASDRGYRDVLCRTIPDAVATEEAKRRGSERMREIIRRAQDAGQLRDDVTLEDVSFLLWGQARTMEIAGAIAPDLWRRHLGLMLDGLRTTAATPLPRPSLTPEEAAQAMSGMCG